MVRPISKPGKNFKRWHIRTSPETAKEIIKIAKAEYTSASEFIRQAIATAIKLRNQK